MSLTTNVVSGMLSKTALAFIPTVSHSADEVEWKWLEPQGVFLASNKLLANKMSLGNIFTLYCGDAGRAGPSGGAVRPGLNHPWKGKHVEDDANSPDLKKAKIRNVSAAAAHCFFAYKCVVCASKGKVQPRLRSMITW